jgi:hypothetical protein
MWARSPPDRVFVQILMSACCLLITVIDYGHHGYLSAQPNESSSSGYTAPAIALPSSCVIAQVKHQPFA